MPVGSQSIEPATASAAAILTQLNQIVQGNQQQQIHANGISYITNDLMTQAEADRTQSEKVCFE